MIDRNTILQNKYDIKDSNSHQRSNLSLTFKSIISVQFQNILNSNLNNRINIIIISATIDGSIQIYNYWTLNDFTIGIYFYIIFHNNIFSFLFLYVLDLKFNNSDLSYKLIRYSLRIYINILIKCLTVIPTKKTRLFSILIYREIEVTTTENVQKICEFLEYTL